MKHMTLSEIADACCGIYCGDPAFLDCEVSSVAIDSRKVVKILFSLRSKVPVLTDTVLSRRSWKQVHSVPL